jgi:hypothetical protein
MPGPDSGRCGVDSDRVVRVVGVGVVRRGVNQMMTARRRLALFCTLPVFTVAGFGLGANWLQRLRQAVADVFAIN